MITRRKMWKEILQLFFIVFCFVCHVNSQNVVPGVCYCVPTGTCNNGTGGGTGTDGSGQIDIRIQTSGSPSTGSTGTSVQLTTAASPGLATIVTSQTFCVAGLERCCPTAGYACGLRYPPVVNSRQPSAGQAAFGSYPWQAVILSPGDIYQGSGALIDHIHVLTAAHKVNAFITNGQQLKVRMGEWDASTATEPLPAQEFNVARIFIHPSFNAANLRNDIAILRLAANVQLGQYPSITTACIPNTLVSNIRCWISGWGRNDFSASGSFQAIQKEVDVPIVDQNTCQNLMRATRLGQNFQLDFTSFMCAGGEAGKDACTGDGGSPLMCQVATNWYVVGLVAWGIGCGTSNVPGVYVNTANFVSWIQQTTRS